MGLYRGDAKLNKELTSIANEITTAVHNSSNEKTDESISGLFLFMSWDLINSTGLKQTNSDWTEQIIKSLQIVVDCLQSNLNFSPKIWRLIGDEIVAYQPVLDLQNLYTYVSYIKSITARANKKIANTVNIDLGFKCTLWISQVAMNWRKDSSRQFISIANRIRVDTNREILDFVGIDIDTGFRLSKFSYKNVITVSPELAKLLLDNSTNDNDIVMWISRFEILKGLYNEKPYPIIWLPIYNENINLSDTVPYYYQFKNPLTEYCFSYLKKGADINNFVLSKEYISRICKDLNLIPKLNYWYNEKIELTKFDLNDAVLQELHCVAVCYNKKEKKVLVLKRTCNRDRFPSLWEFGCAKPIKTISINDAILNEYKEDTGLSLNLMLDENRVERVPKPLAIYQVIDDAKSIHKGIICTAVVDSLDIKLDYKKFSEYKWISKSEIKAFVSENEGFMVNDMEDTLYKVFSFYEEGET